MAEDVEAAMDVPADRSTRAAGPPAPTATRPAARSRRRRPTGEPPPLPHHLQTSGVGWLVATVVLLVLAIVVFGRGLRGLAVDLAAFDSAVVGWLAGIDLPGFRAVMRGLAALSSWWVLNSVAFGLLVVLLVLRRFRHLIIWVILTNLVSFIGGTIIGPVTQRPRPFGVVIRGRLGRLGHAVAARHLLRPRAGDDPLHGRHRRRPGHHPPAVGCRSGPPRHQAGQPAGPRRPPAADRRGLRGGPAQPLAPGRRPGQHDAVPGPAGQPRAGLPAGPAPVLGGGITEGFAAARGLALPSQLRRMLRAQGRDLHAEFVNLLPTPPSRCRSSAGAYGGSGCWAPPRSC
jgi:hypothetical protein